MILFNKRFIKFWKVDEGMARFFYIVEETTDSSGGFKDMLVGLGLVLLVLFGIGIGLYNMVVGPTQRYIYNQINVKYKGRNTEVHVYELGGLYNTFKDRHYRVDYIVPKDKVIKSVYYDDEDKINKRYFAVPTDGEWENQNVNEFPFNLRSKTKGD